MPEHTARSEQDEPWATFTVITAQCNECGHVFTGREMTPHAKSHAVVTNLTYRRHPLQPAAGQRTECGDCGGPYDEDRDSWGVCADCLDSHLPLPEVCGTIRAEHPLSGSGEQPETRPREE